MPMRQIPTREFALYQLDAAGAQVAAACPEPFDARRYSSYTYGSTAAAEWFGQRLAAAYLARVPHAMGLPRVLIAAAPYHRVPSAAAALARGFRTAFNAERTAATGLTAAPLVQIERQVTTTGDYAVLSAAAREEWMAANPLSFGRIDKPELRGAHLIVLDGAKITGAHQRHLIRSSADLALGSRTFLYAAELAERAGQFDPSVEDRLNHARICTLDDFSGMLRERVGDFAWNERVCKFLLSPQRRDELPLFLGRTPGRFIRELHRHSLADGYASMPAYRDSFSLITMELRRREMTAADDVRTLSTTRRHAAARPAYPVLTGTRSA
jgi:hypothetical protein